VKTWGRRTPGSALPGDGIRFTEAEINAIPTMSGVRGISPQTMVEEVINTGDWPMMPPLAPLVPKEVAIRTLVRDSTRAEKILDRFSLTPRLKFEVDLDNIARSNQAQYYQETSNFEFNQERFTQGSVFELARFRTTETVGVVKQMWTSLGITDLSGNIIEWYRSNPLLHVEAGVRVTWHLRLSPNMTVPKDWEETTEQEIPGVPFKPLPYWRDMKFLWGGYNDVFFLIPQQQTLRLFVALQSDDDILLYRLKWVGGRLLGYEQVSGSMETERNVRHGW
jgi:hypothetical protein